MQPLKLPVSPSAIAGLFSLLLIQFVEIWHMGRTRFDPFEPCIAFLRREQVKSTTREPSVFVYVSVVVEQIVIHQNAADQINICVAKLLDHVEPDSPEDQVAVVFQDIEHLLARQSAGVHCLFNSLAEEPYQGASKVEV